ncbi:MAG: hypothetical protein LBT89_03760, partial [Planctomycetaceae bacterium]|jgi:hypothetical protein|nr:hypothetical protein [Planctomycetaceae bacterium]
VKLESTAPKIAFENTFAYSVIYLYTIPDASHQGRVKIGLVTLEKDILVYYREGLDGAGKIYHNGDLSFTKKPDKRQHALVLQITSQDDKL